MPIAPATARKAAGRLANAVALAGAVIHVSGFYWQTALRPQGDRNALVAC
jgi:hypothetical protein